MRVALVHDWLTGMRGGERVLEGLLDLLPDAEIFTLLHTRGSVSSPIEARPIHTSVLDRLPLGKGGYRYLLPAFPAAIERFDLRGFDLVVSSSHCVAKGVRAPPAVPHLCYCHTPMRYVWDHYDTYRTLGGAASPLRLGLPLVAQRLRTWDRESARRVHHFVANSHHVRNRIRRCYDRDAAVVHPPVQVDRFRPAAVREDFYLVVSALVPYKRTDLAVAAFNRLGRPLVIVGHGPEQQRLERAALPNVRFTGRLPDADVADLMSRCRALVFPGIEDFGIVPVEAQAAGAPVIAFGAGGALETVIGAPAGRPLPPGATGVFFAHPTPASLAETVTLFETLTFEAAALAANAARFGPDAFRRGLRRELDRVLSGRTVAHNAR